MSNMLLTITKHSGFCPTIFGLIKGIVARRGCIPEGVPTKSYAGRDVPLASTGSVAETVDGTNF